MLGGSAHLAPMAFLVSGTLRVAAQMADVQESLGRKVVGGTVWPSPLLVSSRAPPSPTLALLPQGKYNLLGPRVGLILSSPEIPASIVTVLEGAFQTLGFESCQRREASVQVSSRLSPVSTFNPTWGLPGPRPFLHSCFRPSLGS